MAPSAVAAARMAGGPVGIVRVGVPAVIISQGLNQGETTDRRDAPHADEDSQRPQPRRVRRRLAAEPLRRVSDDRLWDDLLWNDLLGVDLPRQVALAKFLLAHRLTGSCKRR